MQARTLPAPRGWMWILDGFALWKRNPALITFLVFGYWFCLLVVAAVPFIGQVLMSLAMPALSLGIFNGCKAVAEKRKAGPEILISGFKQNLPEQVKIGGIYLIGTLVVLGLTALADGGILAELMLGKRKLDDATAVWDTIGRLEKAGTVMAHDISLTAESADGQQNVEYSGALEGGYDAPAVKAIVQKLQDIVIDGSLRMAIGNLAFPTGQALLDWLKATNEPFNAAKVRQ